MPNPNYPKKDPANTILNKVFNSDTNRIRVEGITSGGGGSSSIVEVDGTFILNTYVFHDLDEQGNTTYIGKQDSQGRWLIQRLIETNGQIDSTFANISNNALTTIYATAWAGREYLSYNDISELVFESEGNQRVTYSLTSETTIPQGATVGFLGVTNGKSVEFDDFSLVSSQGDIEVCFYEGVTTTTDGVELSGYDLDRVRNSTPTLTPYGGPTVSDEGVLLLKKVIPPTENKVGSSSSLTTNWKLKGGTKYLFKITNNSSHDAQIVTNLYWVEY